MRRGTTPTIELGVDADLTGTQYYVCMENGGNQVIRTQDECSLSDDGRTITMRLTQAETLALVESRPVLFQVRYKAGDAAMATTIAQTSVERILQEGEI